MEIVTKWTVVRLCEEAGVAGSPLCEHTSVCGGKVDTFTQDAAFVPCGNCPEPASPGSDSQYLPPTLASWPLFAFPYIDFFWYVDEESQGPG